MPQFYEFHRRQQDLRYSDRIVCSPAVPVFRDDAGALLVQPYEVTFLTAAAPNAGALADQGRYRALGAPTLGAFEDRLRGVSLA